MLNEHKQYENVLKLAESVISNYIQNYEDKKDLAQLVAMKYHLNRDKINKSIKNWVITTAKNAARDFLKDNKDPIKNATNFELVENKITNTILEEEMDYDPAEILKEFQNELTNREREILEIYARSGFQIKKISKHRKISYEALKKKIYRLKADIRAKYNIQKGMIGSKKIIGAKLNENLLNFIKRFKKAIEDNSLNSMSKYLKECEIPIKIPEIKIHNIIEYDVRLKGDNKYLIFVFYRDRDGKSNCFNTIFEVYNENAIKIIEFPKPSSKLREFNLKDFPKELLEKIKVNEKGVPDMSREEFEELLFQYGLIKKKEF